MTAPGTIEAFERVQVTARVAGVVDKVAFAEGQTVAKGDTLVIIDSERYALGVNSAKAALEKAEAAQKEVDGMLARRQGATEKHPGLIPRSRRRSQFASFLHPVTVLTILPMALAGAVVGLAIAGASLDIFSMIGLLLLMGIVKKNSIVLVEYANQVREEDGLGAAEAMQRAGPVRLRPILMTTFATMMAAVPAVLGLGPGAETRGPMAAAVLGGLALSTVLSLLVVPAFYLLADRLKARIVRRSSEPSHSPIKPVAHPP
ncbi:MAG: efflux RND transporter permease subunit [Myxococcales bacterium]|nr:efflux RND transporter permease subunit [Myxococcales bacterium]